MEENQAPTVTPTADQTPPPNPAPVSAQPAVEDSKKKMPWWAFVLIGCAVLPIILVILGVLAGIVVGVVGTNSKSKAFDAQKKADEAQIQVGLEQFYVDNNRYPNTLNELVPQYLQAIPKSPDTNAYTYTATAGKTYILSVKLSPADGQSETYTLKNRQ